MHYNKENLWADIINTTTTTKQGNSKRGIVVNKVHQLVSGSCFKQTNKQIPPVVCLQGGPTDEFLTNKGL